MIDEETLRTLYIEQELTMSEIAKLYDISVGTIFNLVKKYGFKREKYTERSRQKSSEAMKGRTSPRKGTHLTRETRKKISDSHKGMIRNPSRYGGHIKHRKDGYIYVYVPEHPYSSKEGYVMEHILVMEEAIGRYITRDESVHHKNKVRDDNRLENLELMTSKAHSAYHIKERHNNNQIKYHTVKVKNVTTGEVFNSCREGAKKYGVAPTNISKACKGKIKVKGCVWEYLKEE